MNKSRPGGLSVRRGGSSQTGHMKKLENLFGGSDKTEEKSPEKPRETRKPVEVSNTSTFSIGPAGVSKTPSHYRMRLERIKMADEVEELKEAIDIFVEHHELPGDLDVHLKLLQHPEETIVRKGLGEIVTLISRGELTGSSVVLEALENLESKVKDNDTLSYIDGIRGMLKK